MIVVVCSGPGGWAVPSSSSRSVLTAATLFASSRSARSKSLGVGWIGAGSLFVPEVRVVDALDRGPKREATAVVCPRAQAGELCVESALVVADPVVVLLDGSVVLVDRVAALLVIPSDLSVVFADGVASSLVLSSNLLVELVYGAALGRFELTGLVLQLP